MPMSDLGAWRREGRTFAKAGRKGWAQRLDEPGGETGGDCRYPLQWRKTGQLPTMLAAMFTHSPSTETLK